MNIREQDLYEIENNPHLIGIRLDKEQELWYTEIVAFMDKYGLVEFPSYNFMKEKGEIKLYQRISNYMGTKLFRDTYGL